MGLYCGIDLHSNNHVLTVPPRHAVVVEVLTRRLCDQHALPEVQVRLTPPLQMHRQPLRPTVRVRLFHLRWRTCVAGSRPRPNGP
jgi:hypothetical protein